MARIAAVPENALMDEVVILNIDGLKPNQNVTVVSKLKGDRSDSFYSFAYYTADSAGTVDLSRLPSKGGSYSGIQSMGLFCTMLPSPSNKRKYSRYIVRDVEAPVCFFVSVYSSHLLYSDISKESLLASHVVQRFYKAPGVQRIPVRDGRLRGTLFIPKGDGPFPAVVDIFGTAGGLMEFRAALLASRGILSLSLAFFDYEDLPDTCLDMEMEYFEEAKDFLLAHEASEKSGVGIIGVSTGGTLALVAASYIPGYKCCVSINGPVFGYYATASYKGRVWNAAFPDMKRAFVIDGAVALKNTLNGYFEEGVSPDSVIEYQKSNCSFLFVFGGDDMSVSAEKNKEFVEQMMHNSNCDYSISLYEGAGHLLEPPFSSHAAQTYTKLINMPQKWGGNPKDHAFAQLKAWNEVLTFLKAKLQPIRLQAKL